MCSFHSYSLRNWPQGCWVSIEIKQNWNELNYLNVVVVIIIITITIITWILLLLSLLILLLQFLYDNYYFALSCTLCMFVPFLSIMLAL
jgi:hypothetical protein